MERSRYPGVYWHRKDKRWQVRFKHQGKKYWIGNYHDQEVAARVWDFVAFYVRGPDAKLNFNGALPVGMTQAEVLSRMRNCGLIR